MKPFFTDRQVKQFTLKEKFEYIFKQLNMVLQPKEVPNEYNYINISGKYWNAPTRIKRIPVFSTNEKGIPLINNIELPFVGMEIKVEDNLIEITGEKFCYRFPPDMMPEIWRRLKRML